MKKCFAKTLTRCGFLGLILLLPIFAAAQQGDDDDNFIDPTRPSVSEGATIQKAGVLQIDTGTSGDFRSSDVRSAQSAPLGLRFAAAKWLRLDFDVDTFVSQKDEMLIRETGVGDVSLGFKALVRDKPQERLGVAFSYSITLPSASADKNLGSGRIDHNLRFILNRTLGKTDLVFNASYLNIGREIGDKRDSGAQAVLTVEQKLPQNFGLVGEIFGNTVDEAQPRGLYLLNAVTYKVSKRLRLDAGTRFGFGADAVKFGVFAGLTVGVAGFYRRK